jgi:membrane-associated phospholipid phosphatase
MTHHARGPNPGRGMRSRSGAPAFRRPTARLYTWDILTLSFCGLMIALALAFPHRITMWPAVVGTSSLIMVCVWGLATLHQRTGSPVARAFHEWAFPPLVYVIYLELYWVVGPIHQGWIADPWLMAIDRTVLGVHPTLWLARTATPWLTEISQIAYASFYSFVIVVGVELYARKKYAEFHLYAFACAFGFLASYVGYLLVPAVGPRFTLHDFSALEREMPGMFLTSSLRMFVNAGGLVSSGMANGAAIATAHRDVFPSGHAMMTIIAVFWSWRFRLFLRWPLTVVGAVLVFATVYLRYHYLIDVVAGVACAAICVATTRKFHAWLWSRTGALDGPAGSSRAIRPSRRAPGRRFPVHADPDSAEI